MRISDWSSDVCSSDLLVLAEGHEIDGRYAGYMERQQADIVAFRKDEGLTLPDDLDYAAIGGLSNEVRAKLQQHKPGTLGQAARISGVTPAALSALLGHVTKRRPQGDRTSVVLGKSVPVRLDIGGWRTNEKTITAK